MQAIRDEFLRVPFSEVSINKIIRSAGIPRGSFYQYFDGKEDMLSHILSEYTSILMERASAALDENGGDLFIMLESFVDTAVSFVLATKDNAFLKNLLSDMRIVAQIFSNNEGLKAMSVFSGSLVPRINTETLNIRDSEDLDNLLCIILPVVGKTIAEIFLNHENIEAIRRRYFRTLELLKQGLCKR